MKVPVLPVASWCISTNMCWPQNFSKNFGALLPVFKHQSKSKFLICQRLCKSDQASISWEIFPPMPTPGLDLAIDAWMHLVEKHARVSNNSNHNHNNHNTNNDRNDHNNKNNYQNNIIIIIIIINNNNNNNDNDNDTVTTTTTTTTTTTATTTTPGPILVLFLLLLLPLVLCNTFVSLECGILRFSSILARSSFLSLLSERILAPQFSLPDVYPQHTAHGAF